jgi:toxin ParE1/3/4
MPTFKLTKKAIADLVEIGRYTTKIWGRSQRNKYLKQLDDCFKQLSENPNLGFNCDYIADGYRKFPQGSHLIFYKNTPTESIEIIRVLHKSMDIDSNL